LIHRQQSVQLGLGIQVTDELTHQSAIEIDRWDRCSQTTTIIGETTARSSNPETRDEELK
jgi:hypothetical protein